MDRLLTVPEHGSVPPNVAVLAVTEQEVCPTHAADTTGTLCAELQLLLVAKLVPHVPVGVPNDAKSMARMV